MCMFDSGRRYQNKLVGAVLRGFELRKIKQSYPNGAEKRRRREESKQFLSKLQKVSTFFTVILNLGTRQAQGWGVTRQLLTS